VTPFVLLDIARPALLAPPTPKIVATAVALEALNSFSKLKCQKEDIYSWFKKLRIWTLTYQSCHNSPSEASSRKGSGKSWCCQTTTQK